MPTPPKRPPRPEKAEIAAKTATWAAIPMLLIAVTGFVQAKTATEKEHAAKKDERSLGDNYQSYVEDRITRDEALEKAFIELAKRCGCPCPGIEAVAAGAVPPAAAEGPTITMEPPTAEAAIEERPALGYIPERRPMPTPPPPTSPPTSINLDELAAQFGYRYKK